MSATSPYTRRRLSCWAAIATSLAVTLGCSEQSGSARLLEPTAVVDEVTEPIEVEALPLIPIEANESRVPVSQNILQNGSFEEPPADRALPWSTTASVTLQLDKAVRILDGDSALRVDVTTDEPFTIDQALKTEQRNQFWVVDAFRAGAPHWFRGYIRSEGFAGAVHVEIWDIRIDGETLLAQSGGIGDSVDWTPQSFRFTAPVQSDHLAVRVRCQPAAAGGTFWLDDFDLRQIEGPRKENLLKNPSFEERSPEGPHPAWNLRGGGKATLNDAAVDGASSLAINLNGKVDLAFFQRVDNLTPGKSYVFSAYVRTAAVPGRVTLWVQDVGPVPSGELTGNSPWSELTAEFTLPDSPDATTARVFIRRDNRGLDPSTGGTVYIDACALYEQ